VRLVRQHRLDALALETAPDAVHLEGRARPGALEGGVAGLAVEGVDLQVAHVARLVEVDGGDARAVVVGQVAHVVVEAVDRDLAVGAAHAGEDVGERVDRVGDRAAVHAGVEVAVGALDVDLQRAEPLERQRERGLVLGPLRAVGADHQVAGEALAVRGHERAHRRAADLLLPLEEELDVDGQRPLGLQQRLDREDRREHAALVVGGAARVDPPILQLRVEGVGVPQRERVDRLGVEVPVDQDGRLAGRVQVVRGHHRVPAGLQDLDVLHARGGDALGDPAGGAAHVVGVLGEARDARDAAEVEELLDEAGLLSVEVRLPVAHAFHSCASGRYPSATAAPRTAPARRSPAIGRPR
jgi:hypothetical protein